MATFAPPSGPPPPTVPEGWKAVWNDQYKEWFYVNLHTKQSTWDKPTAPAPRPGGDSPPPGAPPQYSAGSNAPQVSDTKRPLESNNPYNSSSTGPSGETDEQMARRLQAEESSRGQADSYYNSGNANSPAPPGIQGGYPGAPTSPSNPLPARPDSSGKQRGFLGKLLGKSGGSSSPYPQQPHPGSGFPPQPMGYNQGPPPNQYPYGGPPPGQWGGYPPGPGYGPSPYGPGPYGGGYGGGYGYGQQQQKKSGLGAGGAAALGLGGGLIGGALLADAINDGQQDAYQDGYQDGGGGGGGDGGGGDF